MRWGAVGGVLPFRWTNATGLRLLPGGGGEARAIGAGGRVVAGNLGADPAVWIDDRPAISLRPFIPGPTRGPDSFGMGLSADGRVVVGSAEPDGRNRQAFRCEITLPDTR